MRKRERKKLREWWKQRVTPQAVYNFYLEQSTERAKHLLGCCEGSRDFMDFLCRKMTNFAIDQAYQNTMQWYYGTSKDKLELVYPERGKVSARRIKVLFVMELNFTTN